MNDGIYVRDKRAITLKAADARRLLSGVIPFVLQRLTEAEVSKVQKVLDAAVVNVAVKEEYQKLMDKAVMHKIAGQVNRDPRIVQEADRVFRSAIRVFDEDKHIRLDYRKLLAPGALMALSDNPDEIAYLEKVRQALDRNGIWLRFDHKVYKDPNEYTRTIYNDSRAFTAWLSYGYDGPAVEAPAGILTRDAILNAVWVGKGYYSEVHRGPTLMALRYKLEKLKIEIEEGKLEHARMIRINDQAKPGVVFFSELVSGSDMPSTIIWELPDRLTLKALELQRDGKLSLATPYAIMAAFATRDAAQSLVDYSNGVAGGAGKMVKFLKGVEVSASVAESLLGPVSSAAKFGVKHAVKNAVSNSLEDKLAAELLQHLEKTQPEIYGNRERVEVMNGPKGTITGGRYGLKQGVGKGFHRWP